MACTYLRQVSRHGARSPDTAPSFRDSRDDATLSTTARPITLRPEIPLCFLPQQDNVVRGSLQWHM